MDAKKKDSLGRGMFDQMKAKIEKWCFWMTECGNVMGNQKIELPTGHTWKSYINFQLKSMPPVSEQH